MSEFKQPANTVGIKFLKTPTGAFRLSYSEGQFCFLSKDYTTNVWKNKKGGGKEVVEVNLIDEMIDQGYCKKVSQKEVVDYIIKA